MFSKLTAYLFGIGILIACLTTSCKDDTEIPANQVVRFQFNAKSGSNDFGVGDIYTNAAAQRYNILTLLFYVSHLQLNKSDGTTVTLSDVELYDLITPSTIVKTIPTGSYTGISFGLGLDSTLNATDPATLQAPNPLSYAIAPYWGWAAKYIFAKIEGFVTADATATPTTPFLFHTGTDQLFRQVNIARNFEIGADTLDLNVTLNLDKLWSNPQTIDLINNGYTQTVDNFPDAETFVNNFAVAFE